MQAVGVDSDNVIICVYYKTILSYLKEHHNEDRWISYGKYILGKSGRVICTKSTIIWISWSQYLEERVTNIKQILKETEAERNSR